MRNILISLIACVALAGGSVAETGTDVASQLVNQQVFAAITTGNERLDAGDAQAALASFDTAATQAPAQPAAWIGLAAAHRQNGDDASARAALREAKRRIAGASAAERGRITEIEQGLDRTKLVAMAR